MATYEPIRKGDIIIIDDKKIQTANTAQTTQLQAGDTTPEAFKNSNVWIKINDKPQILSTLLAKASEIKDSDNEDDQKILENINKVFEKDFFKGNMMYNTTAKKAPEMWNFRNKLTPLQQSLLLIPKVKLILLQEDENTIIETSYKNSSDPFADLIQEKTSSNVNNSQMETISELVNNIENLNAHRDIKKIIQVQSLKVDWKNENIASKEADLEVYIEHEQLIKSRVIKYLTSPGARVRLEVSYDNIIEKKDIFEKLFPESNVEYEEYKEFCEASKKELATSDFDGTNEKLIDWTIYDFKFKFQEDKSVILSIHLVQAGFTTIQDMPQINVINLLSPKVVNYFIEKDILKISTANIEKVSDKNSIFWMPELGIDANLTSKKPNKKFEYFWDKDGTTIKEIKTKIPKKAYFIVDYPTFMIHLLWLYAYEYKKLYDEKEHNTLNKNFIINFNVDMKTDNEKRSNGTLVNQIPKIISDKTSEPISLSLFNYKKLNTYIGESKKTTLGFKYLDLSDIAYKYTAFDELEELKGINYYTLLNSNAQWSFVEKKIYQGISVEIKDWHLNSNILEKVNNLKFEKSALIKYKKEVAKICKDFAWFYKYFTAGKGTGSIWCETDPKEELYNKFIKDLHEKPGARKFRGKVLGQGSVESWLYFFEHAITPPLRAAVYTGAFADSVTFIIKQDHQYLKEWYLSWSINKWLKNKYDNQKDKEAYKLNLVKKIQIKWEKYYKKAFEEINKKESDDPIALLFYTAIVVQNDIDESTLRLAYKNGTTFDNLAGRADSSNTSGRDIKKYIKNPIDSFRGVGPYFKGIRHNHIGDINMILNVGLDDLNIDERETNDIQIEDYLKWLVNFYNIMINIFDEEIKELDKQIDIETHENTSWNKYYNHYISSIWKTEFTNNDEASDYGWYKNLDKPIGAFIEKSLSDILKDKIDYFTEFEPTDFKSNNANEWNSIISDEIKTRSKEDSFTQPKASHDLQKDGSRIEKIKETKEKIEVTDPCLNYKNIKLSKDRNKKIEEKNKETKTDKAKTHVFEYIGNKNNIEVITEIRDEEYVNSLSNAERTFYKKALETDNLSNTNWLEVHINDFGSITPTEEDIKQLNDVQEQVLLNLEKSSMIYINHNYDQNIISMNFIANYGSDMPFKLGLYSNSVKKDNSIENAEKLRNLKKAIDNNGSGIANSQDRKKLSSTLGFMALAAKSEHNVGSNMRNIMAWAGNKSDLTNRAIQEEVMDSPIWSEKLFQDTNLHNDLKSLYDMMNFEVSAKTYFVPEAKLWMPTFIYSGGEDIKDLHSNLAKNNFKLEGAEWANQILDRISIQSGMYKITEFGWEINQYGEWISNFKGIKYEVGFMNLINKIFVNDVKKTKSNILTFEDLDYQKNIFNIDFIISGEDYENNYLQSLSPLWIANDFPASAGIEDVFSTFTYEDNKWKLDAYLNKTAESINSIINISEVEKQDKDHLRYEARYLNDFDNIDRLAHFTYGTELVLKRDDHPSLNPSNINSQTILFDAEEKDPIEIERFKVRDSSWLTNLLYSESFQAKIENLDDCPTSGLSWSDYIVPTPDVKAWLESNKLSHNYSISENNVESYLHYRFIRYAWYFLANITEDFIGEGYFGIDTLTTSGNKITELKYKDSENNSIKYEEEYNLYFDTFAAFKKAVKEAFLNHEALNFKKDFDEYVEKLKKLEWSEVAINDNESFKMMIESKLKGKYLEIKKDIMVASLSHLKNFIQKWKESKLGCYEDSKTTDNRYGFNFDFIEIESNWKTLRFTGENKKSETSSSQKKYIHLNMSLGSFTKRMERNEEIIKLNEWSNLKKSTFKNEKWFMNYSSHAAYNEVYSFDPIIYEEGLSDADANYFASSECESSDTTATIYMSYDKSRNKAGKSVGDYRNKYGKLSFVLDNNNVYKYTALIEDNKWNTELLHTIDDERWEEAINAVRIKNIYNTYYYSWEEDAAKTFKSYTKKFTGDAYPQEYANNKPADV